MARQIARAVKTLLRDAAQRGHLHRNIGKNPCMDQMDATHSMPQMPGNCKAKRENLTSENAREIFALIRRLEGGSNGRLDGEILYGSDSLCKSPCLPKLSAMLGVD